MNKSEIQRTVNNIKKIQHAIYTNHLKKFDDVHHVKQLDLRREQILNLIEELEQIKKEV